MLEESKPRYKVSRQLFLMLNSINLSNNNNVDKLKVLINKVIECTIPQHEAENEVCLYNADESVRQMVIQMVATREEEERLVLFDGVRKILDMYMSLEVSSKEFVKANNATYPHPAYVGLQASLDALNYIAIWCTNLGTKRGSKPIPLTDPLCYYLQKFRNRLTKMPHDIGIESARAIFYYE